MQPQEDIAALVVLLWGSLTLTEVVPKRIIQPSLNKVSLYLERLFTLYSKLLLVTKMSAVPGGRVSCL